MKLINYETINLVTISKWLNIRKDNIKQNNGG